MEHEYTFFLTEGRVIKVKAYNEGHARELINNGYYTIIDAGYGNELEVDTEIDLFEILKIAYTE